MTSIGKVFLVLNLVFAAIFVGSAANLIGTSQEWRSRYEEEARAHSADQEASQQQIDDLQAQVQQLGAEADRLRAQVKQLEGEKAAADSDLEDARRKNAELTDSLAAIREELKALESTNGLQLKRLTEQEREIASLRDERDAAKAQAHEAVLARDAAVAQLDGLKAQIGELTSKLQQAEENARASESALLAAARLYNFDPRELSAAPVELEGVVLKADYSNPDLPVIVINLGRKDQVKPGYKLDVYRGGQYKGQIQVQVVNMDTSAAVIALAGDSPIHEGDRVTTKL